MRFYTRETIRGISFSYLPEILFHEIIEFKERVNYLSFIKGIDIRCIIQNSALFVSLLLNLFCMSTYNVYMYLEHVWRVVMQCLCAGWVHGTRYGLQNWGRNSYSNPEFWIRLELSRNIHTYSPFSFFLSFLKRGKLKRGKVLYWLLF